MSWKNQEIQDSGFMMAFARSYDVIATSQDIITHEGDLKGNMFKRPIHTQSLIVMAFGTEGDKTDQKKPSLKMSTFIAQTYSVLAFHPQGFP